MVTGGRRLADLFVVGRDAVFDDGRGDPVTVWLQKLNAAENEKALRRANAERSRICASQKDLSSDEYLSIDGEASRLEHDELVQALVDDEVAKRAPKIEAEIAADEEWSKDNYLQGLRDAWTETLWRIYAEDPEDPEAKRVLGEIERFANEVKERIDGESEDIRRTLTLRPDESLREKYVEMRLKLDADQMWLKEFRRCEIWLATRDPENHRGYYFQSRGEVDELPIDVLVRLLQEYRDLALEPLEGKDSRKIQSSSPPSDSPEPLETDSSSGPEGVPA